MKKLLLFSALWCCSITLLAQQNFELKEPTVLKTIDVPINDVLDITFDGQFLWVGSYNTSELVQIDPKTQKMVKKLEVDIERAQGLTFDGEYFYVADNVREEIQRVDPNDGKILGSLPNPNNIEFGLQTGLTWDGKNFWQHDAGGWSSDVPGVMYVIGPQGQVIESFPAFGDFPTGVTFDGKYLYTADNTLEAIHKINPRTYEIIESYAAPGGAYPNGLAWDGEYLWVGNNETDKLYQMDVSTDDELVEVEEEEVIQVTQKELLPPPPYPPPTQIEIIEIEEEGYGDEEIEIVEVVVEETKQEGPNEPLPILPEIMVEELPLEEAKEEADQRLAWNEIAPESTIHVYPNPFREQVNISFELETEQEVSLVAFDAMGRPIKEIYRGSLPAGQHSYTWSSMDRKSGDLANGRYFLTLIRGDHKVSKQVIHIR